MMDDKEILIRELSEKAFREHCIKERMRDGVFRSWRCQRHGSWFYGFDLTTTPGSLIVTGDLGSIVLCREYDMLPWAAKSVDDLHYFAGKMTAGPAPKEFSEEKLTAWLKEKSRDSKLSTENRERCRELLIEVGHRDPGWFMSETYPDLWQDEPPNLKEWNPSLCWLRDAIRWFGLHHSESEIKVPS